MESERKKNGFENEALRELVLEEKPAMFCASLSTSQENGHFVFWPIGLGDRTACEQCGDNSPTSAIEEVIRAGFFHYDTDLNCFLNRRAAKRRIASVLVPSLGDAQPAVSVRSVVFVLDYWQTLFLTFAV